MIGVTIDLSNAHNKNGNPVAEKNNQEVQNAILSITPTGGQISELELSEAISALNSKPRWTGMSAGELWTGRDMTSGAPLKFSQQNIIERQQSRRAKTHLRPNLPSKEFAVGDIVFSNTDRSKLKARDKLIVREYLGNGQYKLDRLCSKSLYTTSTIKPDYDLYTVETEKDTSPSKPKKTVTWKDDVTVIIIEDESPAPEQTEPAQDTTTSRSRPTTRASTLQRRPRAAPPARRPIPPAPGKAANYNPRLEHLVQDSPQPRFEYLVTPAYESDREEEAPPTAEEPPQNDTNEPDTPGTPDAGSDDSEEDVFHSPGGSHQGSPSDSSDHDTEHTDQNEGSDQSQNNSGNSEQADRGEAPERADQSEAPDQGRDNPGTNNTTPASDDELDNNAHLERLARGREPVERHRSRTRPPTQQVPAPRPVPDNPGPAPPPVQGAPAQQRERVAHPQRENSVPKPARGATAQQSEKVTLPQFPRAPVSPVPRPAPSYKKTAPPTAQGAPPQQVTTRSGRVSMGPATLVYQPGHVQQETRHPTGKFRAPGPVAPKPPKRGPTDV